MPGSSSGREGPWDRQGRTVGQARQEWRDRPGRRWRDGQGGRGQPAQSGAGRDAEPGTDTCTHTHTLRNEGKYLCPVRLLWCHPSCLSHAVPPPRCPSSMCPRRDALPDPPLRRRWVLAPAACWRFGSLTAPAMACVHYFFFFFSSLPFTIHPPQPSLPVPPEPPAVPARREIGSEHGTGILPQLTEPCQAQAALLPATSLGTGGRGAVGGCRGLAALPRHCAPQPPPRLRCQMPNGGRKRGEGRERSWRSRARQRRPTRDPFPSPRPAGRCPRPSTGAPQPARGAGVTWRG